MLGAHLGERGAQKEGLVGFLGDVEDSERKGTYDLLLKDKQEFTRWKSEGRASASEGAGCAETRRME